MSLNVIKVLSVITFGLKCNKGLECNICSASHEITVGDWAELLTGTDTVFCALRLILRMA